MDLTHKFLPSEKLLKKYEDIILDSKGDSILVLTNLRIFLGNKFHVWDVPCKNVDYMKRGFVPRFSRWWLLLFTPLSLIFIGNLIFFLIFVTLSIASQYIKTDALTIGTPTRKWNIRAEPELLDKITSEIRLNSLVGDKKDGKIILEAENLDDDAENVNVELIGQNESRALKAAWVAAVFAFMSYYIGSFGVRTGFWTFLFTATAFCFFVIHRDRKKSNEIRELEPEDGWTKYIFNIILTKMGFEVIDSKWSFKLFGRDVKARNAGYLIFSAILLFGLFVTVASSSMKPLLMSLAIGSPIYLTGRALAGIPRPWKRMALRSLACSIIAIMIILPCLVLIPLYNSASVKLPETFIQGDSGNGWKSAMSQHDEYGLGFASTSFFLYLDDGEDSEGDRDGYPAMLFVIAIKVPIDLDERDALNELDKQFREMSLEQEIDLKEHITNGTRTNKQGYQTQYVIYNGTAKSERLGPDEMGVNITKGSETRYIGEVWKAPEYNLIVVSMGIAVVSSQEINDQTGIDPVDNLIDNLIPNKPTDTRDTKNWDELYELIPEIVCLSTD